MSVRALVLYDGECRFCVRAVERLRALDWLGRLAYASARDAEVLARHTRVDPGKALERLHLVTPDGRVREGFFAFRWLAGRLPALWPVWPLLWLPGIPAVGQRIYDLVARNRFGLGRCPEAGCASAEGGPGGGGPPPA